MISLVDLSARIGQDIAAVRRSVGSLTARVDEMDASGVIQIPAGGDLDTATAPGVYGYQGQAGSVPATVNAPTALPGRLLVAEVRNSAGTVTEIGHLAIERGGALYTREYRSSSWSRWSPVGGGASVPAGRESTRSGVKTVPLVLTAGIDTTDSGWAERGVRMHVHYAAPITSWRLHLRNWSQFSGVTRTGSVALTGVWLGDHAGNGVPANVVQVTGAANTPADGSEWVSPWSTLPLGDGVERLLMIGYTGGGATGPIANQGLGWHTASASDAATTAAATRTLTTPFEWWIEARTSVDTPVVAAFGDSITSGARATGNLSDSWLSVYCRANGALPRHVSAHGDSMINFLRTDHEKVTRWENYTPADAVIWAMGSNDIGPRPTLATLVANFQVVKGVLERALGPIRYAATVTPRGTNWDAEQTALWQSWNTILPTLAPWVDVFDFNAVVNDGNDALAAGFDGGDGVHPNTAGYQAMAAAITLDLH